MPRFLELASRATNDVAGANAVALAYLGDRLGLFRALEEGSRDEKELAQRARVHVRYAREWANAMVTCGYLELDAEKKQYWLSDEQKLLFLREGFPTFMGGALQVAVGAMHNVHVMLERFRDGGGVSYSELPPDIPEGVERLWGPTHQVFMPFWLPRIAGLMDRLAAGGTICDVGCGRGRSSLALASIFPSCEVVGIDSDGPSLRIARERAAASPAAHRIRFIQQDAQRLEFCDSLEMVYAFFSIHDMPQPSSVLAGIRRGLKSDGFLLWTEPNASEDPLANRNSPGRAFATISPLYNLPVAMAVGNEGTGTSIPEASARALAREAGFASFEVYRPPESPLVQLFVLRP